MVTFSVLIVDERLRASEPPDSSRRTSAVRTGTLEITLLASGAAAPLYRVLNERGVPVAPKVPRGHLADYPGALFHEQSMFERLRDPGIVRLLGAGWVGTVDLPQLEDVPDGTPFLVEEFVEGGTLGSWMPWMTWDDFAIVIFDVLQALGFVRRLG